MAEVSIDIGDVYIDSVDYDVTIIVRFTIYSGRVICRDERSYEYEIIDPQKVLLDTY